MDLGLKDRVAVITGGGSGIGRATSEIFAAEGAKVVVVDLNSRSGNETVAAIIESGGEAIFRKADVSTADGAKAIARAAKKAFGGVDILHNNAAIIRSHSVTDTSEKEWDKIVDVNLKSIYLCSRQCIPIMIKRGGGSIVNTASVHSFASIPNISAYAAAKGGVLALTRQMAQDYAKDNIQVNCICPGATDTPMLQSALDIEPDPEQARRDWESSCPLNRLGRPEDLGHAVAFLASDKASFITGQALIVDGGMLSRL